MVPFKVNNPANYLSGFKWFWILVCSICNDFPLVTGQKDFCRPRNDIFMCISKSPRHWLLKRQHMLKKTNPLPLLTAFFVFQ